MMDIEEFARRFHYIVLQPHQLKWIEFLERVKKRGILLAPRGHGKTTTLNQIYLSWVIANNPRIRILMISHSKDMAESFSRTIRTVMENLELQREFDIAEDTPWRANEWRLKDSPHAKPTLVCKGVLGRMTGWRGDMVFCDDILEITGANSPATRQKIKDWMGTSVIPAIDPGEHEKMIYVGTRKHIEDIYGECLENPEYEKLVDRALDEENNPLWPYILDEKGKIIREQFTYETLMQRRMEIGPLRFAQEYMNQPSPPEGRLLKYDWLKFYEHLPTHGHIEYFIGIDPSHGSKNEGTSYFAYAVVAYDKVYQNIYVVDFFRSRLSKEEQIQKAMVKATEYAPTAIFVEAVFEYTHVYNALKNHFRNVVSVDYIHQKLKGVSVVNKQERIMNVCAPAFEMGQLYIREPSKDPQTRTFINYEYVPFPDGDDDMLDALTLAIHRLVGTRSTGDIPFFSPD